MSTSSSYHNHDRSKTNDAIAGKRASAAGLPAGAQQTAAGVPPEPPADRADVDPISFKRNGVAEEARSPLRTASRRQAAAKYL